MSSPGLRRGLVAAGLLVAAAVALVHLVSAGRCDFFANELYFIVCGRHPALGYFKHPPLSGWICGLWFSVFPSADWAFYLLGMINAAAGLWIIDRIAQRYVPAGTRPMVILLLLMTPFFQFFGQKFNANTILLNQ